jgi:hypothetical protein
VKHALGNVDPEYAHLWFHWTRLLWLYGFTDRELSVAHRSRSALGRIHFITTLRYGFVVGWRYLCNLLTMWEWLTTVNIASMEITPWEGHRAQGTSPEA